MLANPCNTRLQRRVAEQANLPVTHLANPIARRSAAAQSQNAARLARRTATVVMASASATAPTASDVTSVRCGWRPPLDMSTTSPHHTNSLAFHVHQVLITSTWRPTYPPSSAKKFFTACFRALLPREGGHEAFRSPPTRARTTEITPRRRPPHAEPPQPHYPRPHTVQPHPPPAWPAAQLLGSSPQRCGGRAGRRPTGSHDGPGGGEGRGRGWRGNVGMLRACATLVGIRNCRVSSLSRTCLCDLSRRRGAGCFQAALCRPSAKLSVARA